MLPKILNKNKPVLVLDDNIIAGIKEKLGPIDSSSNGLTEVTWQELKGLRDNSKLSPGSLYRITDYQCTTTQKNTKSAGHQFDIVLLALSENKLAEEGWAMMHDNIYDVTFADGVTKKCWVYITDEENKVADLVIVDTLLGYASIGYDEDDELTLDTQNHTATCVFTIDEITDENLTYNYFQNSKLEAWKVWYCLDNDKSRFAWADDSVPQIYSNDDEIWLERDITKDRDNRFAWYNSGDDITYYTDNMMPRVGEQMYIFVNGWSSGGEVGGVKGFGRGVIYRLIDEWNNDCPYDFKNIQYKRKVDSINLPTIGNDVNESFFYTFSIVNEDNHEILDASIFAKKFVNDEQGEGRCYSNFISSIDEYTADVSTNNIYTLPDIVFAKSVINYDSACLFVNIKCYQSKSLTILNDIADVNFINTEEVNSNNAYSELRGVTICNLINRIIDNSALTNKKFVSAIGDQLQTINLINL